MENNINLNGLLRDNTDDRPVNCSKCGSFLKYQGLGEYRCEDCGYREYDNYGKVRAFLEKNPGASVVQVEAATKVPQKIVYQLVTEGKLEIRPGGYTKRV